MLTHIHVCTHMHTAATPSGLITPVVKDAGNKSILQISAESKDMGVCVCARVRARVPKP